MKNKIVPYVNFFRELQNNLSEIGNDAPAKEQLRALSRGLRKKFSVSVEVISSKDKSVRKSIELMV